MLQYTQLQSVMPQNPVVLLLNSVQRDDTQIHCTACCIYMNARLALHADCM